MISRAAFFQLCRVVDSVAGFLAIAMALTRLGDDSKMVVTGNSSQVDLKPGVRSGLAETEHALEGWRASPSSAFRKRPSSAIRWSAASSRPTNATAPEAAYSASSLCGDAGNSSPGTVTGGMGSGLTGASGSITVGIAPSGGNSADVAGGSMPP